jgi:hypothetical protein
MKLRGIVVASAALGLLASAGAGTATAEHHEGGGKVKCAGINSCSGKGACSAADGSHGCAGKNACKGKGWVHVESEKECTEKSGTVQE